MNYLKGNHWFKLTTKRETCTKIYRKNKREVIIKKIFHMSNINSGHYLRTITCSRAETTLLIRENSLLADNEMNRYFYNTNLNIDRKNSHGCAGHAGSKGSGYNGLNPQRDYLIGQISNPVIFHQREVNLRQDSQTQKKPPAFVASSRDTATLLIT